ncbi:hypothetical protein PI124_g20073 [Phytophthora idaei]|nr:hypothetical protein PI125_g18514 [Phytophthora idaei]KAG3132374.1 hypothetical protein PI126_g19671 [Phytophthora idaei]KAG3234878.1 hypothetical protein PI124_g20073 [Phytophthora idaei]
MRWANEAKRPDDSTLHHESVIEADHHLATSIKDGLPREEEVVRRHRVCAMTGGAAMDHRHRSNRGVMNDRAAMGLNLCSTTSGVMAHRVGVDRHLVVMIAKGGTGRRDVETTRHVDLLMDVTTEHQILVK